VAISELIRHPQVHSSGARICSLLALWSIVGITQMDAHAAAMAAERPSFDCDKADTNSTRLICADTFLMALDLRLADAYNQRLAKESGPERARLLAQQRAWLAENATACRPPDPRNVGFAETVEPRLCLSQRYLDRLAALGAAPTPPTEAPNNKLGVHPRCIQLVGDVLADGQPSASLPLTQCNRVYRDVSVRRSDDGWLEAEGATPFVPWFRFKPVASLSDGSWAVAADWSANGAGYSASAILRLREEGPGEGKSLLARILVLGGSNCQRGILDAKSTVDGALDVVFAVTPYDLVVSVLPSLRTREDLSALTGNSGPTRDACVGSLVQRYVAPYVTGTIESATLGHPAGMVGSPIDDCFMRIFSIGSEQQKTVLDSAELQTRTDAFTRACLIPIR
jgi:uncharacterized protein